MPSFYGDSIGDAARAEERALERSLNLGLANRQFQQQQQQREDALDQAAAEFGFRNVQAANALAANEAQRRLQERSLGLDQSRFAANLGLSREQLNLDRERIGSANKVRAEAESSGAEYSLYDEWAKRIDAGLVRSYTELPDVVLKTLPPERLDSLYRIIANKQREQAQLQEFGFTQGASYANELLANKIKSEKLEDPASKAYALDAVLSKLDKSIKPYVVPDLSDPQNPVFRPRANPASGYPTEAARNLGLLPEPQKAAVAPEDPPPPPSASQGSGIGRSIARAAVQIPAYMALGLGGIAAGPYVANKVLGPEQKTGKQEKEDFVKTLTALARAKKITREEFIRQMQAWEAM